MSYIILVVHTGMGDQLVVTMTDKLLRPLDVLFFLCSLHILTGL